MARPDDGGRPDRTIGQLLAAKRLDILPRAATGSSSGTSDSCLVGARPLRQSMHIVGGRPGHEVDPGRPEGRSTEASIQSPHQLRAAVRRSRGDRTRCAPSAHPEEQKVRTGDSWPSALRVRASARPRSGPSSDFDGTCCYTHARHWDGTESTGGIAQCRYSTRVLPRRASHLAREGRCTKTSGRDSRDLWDRVALGLYTGASSRPGRVLVSPLGGGPGALRSTGCL